MGGKERAMAVDEAKERVAIAETAQAALATEESTAEAARAEAQAAAEVAKAAMTAHESAANATRTLRDEKAAVLDSFQAKIWNPFVALRDATNAVQAEEEEPPKVASHGNTMAAPEVVAVSVG